MHGDADTDLAQYPDGAFDYVVLSRTLQAVERPREVLRQLQPTPDQIDRIDIATYRFASVMRNPSPPNFFASKYSLPHAAAVMAVTGGAGHAQLDDTALTDPVVAALRPRVHIAEDPSMTALVPDLRPARVSVRLIDSRCVEHTVQSHRGDFRDPFDAAEIRAKFRALAAEVLTPAGVAAMETAVDACADWDRAAVLPELVARYARA